MIAWWSHRRARLVVSPPTVQSESPTAEARRMPRSLYCRRWDSGTPPGRMPRELQRATMAMPWTLRSKQCFHPNSTEMWSGGLAFSPRSVLHSKSGSTSNSQGILPSAAASLSMLSSEIFLAHRSTWATKVRCNPASSAKSSCDHPSWRRKCFRFCASDSLLVLAFTPQLR